MLCYDIATTLSGWAKLLLKYPLDLRDDREMRESGMEMCTWPKVIIVIAA